MQTNLRKKIVVVGDGASGKTSLLMAFTKGVFPTNYVPTVFENIVTDISVCGQQVELNLFDTAGQEDYDRLRRLSYPDTDLTYICFSIDSHTSFENVADKWISEVVHYCNQKPIILVGLKTDLRYDDEVIKKLLLKGKRPISYSEGLEMAKRIGADYYECSAKYKEGVTDLFQAGARKTLNYKHIETKPPSFFYCC
ncbi:GTP-binding protein Rho1 [Boothiomyces sp. JEL0866]|nr:GTP-binding protein Rho1 [Boothiomyces sp. JEL0866]